VGNTSIDPIEYQIDIEGRYEVFDELIYDHRKKVFIPQSDCFKIFSKEVSLLRSKSKLMGKEEIVQECNRLSKIEIDVELNNVL
jgi:hypothetical protein